MILDIENRFERKPFVVLFGIACLLFLISGIITGSYIAFITKSPEYNASYETLVNIFSMIIDYSPLLSVSIGAMLGSISNTSSKSFDINYGKTIGLGLASGLLGYLLFLFSVLAITNYVSLDAYNYLIDIRNFWLSFFILTFSLPLICAFSTLLSSYLLRKGKIGGTK